MDVSNQERSLVRVRSQDSAAALGPKLRQARRRVRVLLLLRGGSQGLLCAAMGLCGLIFLNKMQPFALFTFARLSGLLAAGTTAGALLSLRSRLSDLDMARLLEGRAALQERLSSAIEFRQQGVDFASPFYGEQWADANRCASHLDVRRLFPARVPRALLPAALLLIVCCLIQLAPGSSGLKPSRGQSAQETDAVRSAAAAIEQAAEQAVSNTGQPLSSQAKQAAQEVKSLAARMRQGGMDKKQSLVALHKLIQKFARQEQTGQEASPPYAPEQSVLPDAPPLGRTPDKAASLQQAGQAGEAGRPQNAPEPQNSKAGSRQSEAKDKTSTEKQNTEKQSLQNTRLQAATPGSQQKARQTAGQMPPKTGQMQERQKGQAAQALRRKDAVPGETNPNTRNATQNAAALQKLTQALKAGRQALTAGSKSGAGGKGAGQGTQGSGSPSRTLPDQANTQPNVIASNRNQKSQFVSRTVDARKSVQDTAVSSRLPRYKPNALVRGTRTAQGAEIQIGSTGAAADPARSQTPYYKAYETGRKQAESALDKETVPAAYKQQVKDYFDSIHP